MRDKGWLDDLSPYQVLEIASDASVEEIREAVKVMSQIWHPDRFKEGGAAHQKASGRQALIFEARDLLLDPRRRGAFDRAAAPVATFAPSHDPRCRGSIWKGLAAFLKDEDLGSPFQRQMAYKMGDALERGRDLTEKQKPYADQAWDLGMANGFDPDDD